MRIWTELHDFTNYTACDFFGPNVIWSWESAAWPLKRTTILFFARLTHLQNVFTSNSSIYWDALWCRFTHSAWDRALSNSQKVHLRFDQPIYPIQHSIAHKMINKSITVHCETHKRSTYIRFPLSFILNCKRQRNVRDHEYHVPFSQNSCFYKLSQKVLAGVEIWKWNVSRTDSIFSFPF